MRTVQILQTALLLAVMTPVLQFLASSRPKSWLIVGVCVLFCLIGMGRIAVLWMARDVKW
jgi:hypothetical protein